MANRAEQKYAHERGFSLIEISVALAVIALGIIGTLSLISANRVLTEMAWAQQRLTLVSQSVLDSIEMRFLTGDDFSAFDTDNTYSWSSDPFSLQSIFVDNGFKASQAVLAITPSSDSDIDYDIRLDLESASGHELTKQRQLFTPLR